MLAPQSEGHPKHGGVPAGPRESGTPRAGCHSVGHSPDPEPSDLDVGPPQPACASGCAGVLSVIWVATLGVTCQRLKAAAKPKAWRGAWWDTSGRSVRLKIGRSAVRPRPWPLSEPQVIALVTCGFVRLGVRSPMTANGRETPGLTASCPELGHELGHGYRCGASLMRTPGQLEPASPESTLGPPSHPHARINTDDGAEAAPTLNSQAMKDPG
jgi:hypothetical protein